MNVGHLLLDSITYQVSTGASAAGLITWGSQTTVAARVEHGTKMVINADGLRREAEHVIVTEVEIPLTARVWMPGDSTADINQSKRPISSKQATALLGGYTLYETYF